MARKDLLSRLTDAGEEAIQRLSESPGADKVTGVAHAMRDRMDELQKRVRGIDELEKRVAALEARLDALSGAKGTTRAPARRKSPTTTRRKSTTSAKTGTRKGTTSKGSSSAKTGGGSPG